MYNSSSSNHSACIGLQFGKTKIKLTLSSEGHLPPPYSIRVQRLQAMQEFRAEQRKRHRAASLALKNFFLIHFEVFERFLTKIAVFQALNLIHQFIAARALLAMSYVAFCAHRIIFLRAGLAVI